MSKIAGFWKSLKIQIARFWKSFQISTEHNSKNIILKNPNFFVNNRIRRHCNIPLEVGYNKGFSVFWAPFNIEETDR